MDVIILLSILFLLSPVLGYVVILLPLSMRAKLMVAAVAAVFLVVTPIAVMLLFGGGFVGS
jgi:hypothetical protein